MTEAVQQVTGNSSNAAAQPLVLGSHRTTKACMSLSFWCMQALRGI